jgi:hypothetical protein
MQTHLYTKAQTIGRHYLDWLSKSTWRCVLGLYVTGVVATFALWGICKLLVLLLAWLLSI